MKPATKEKKPSAGAQTEIDRLVREQLEQGYEERVHAKERLSKMASYRESWRGRTEGALREGTWSLVSLLAAARCNPSHTCECPAQGKEDETTPARPTSYYDNLEEETVDFAKVPQATKLAPGTTAPGGPGFR